MNSLQYRLLLLAALNLVVVLLFPPFNSVGLGLGGSAPTFDAFYFAFDPYVQTKTINGWLLALEFSWLAANTALALSMLRTSQGARIMSARSGVIAFAVVNLVVILLMPPFENYASVLRMTGTYFDGFYLAFGDKWQRRFYIPLLYLEVFWLLINAAAAWLMMRPERDAAPSSN